MQMKIFDISGRQPKIGDKVAFSEVWTTNISYLNLATIENIIESEKHVKLVLKVYKTGIWNNNKCNYTVTMIYPRLHTNFVIISGTPSEPQHEVQ